MGEDSMNTLATLMSVDLQDSLINFVVIWRFTSNTAGPHL